MATKWLRDRDRLNDASNYVIWNDKMSLLLNEHGLKTYPDNVVAKPTYQQQLANFRKKMAKMKQMILEEKGEYFRAREDIFE